MAILVFGDFFVFTNNIRSTRFIIGNLRKEEFVMNKEEVQNIEMQRCHVTKLRERESQNERRVG